MPFELGVMLTFCMSWLAVSTGMLSGVPACGLPKLQSQQWSYMKWFEKQGGRQTLFRHGVQAASLSSSFAVHL
jgi:hypothetical protein